jgi:hypothetical protein
VVIRLADERSSGSSFHISQKFFSKEDGVMPLYLLVMFLCSCFLLNSPDFKQEFIFRPPFKKFSKGVAFFPLQIGDHVFIGDYYFNIVHKYIRSLFVHFVSMQFFSSSRIGFCLDKYLEECYSIRWSDLF